LKPLAVNMITLDIERTYWKEGLEKVAGVDEAGRGPLAGPVVAAAVIFRPESWIEGLRDSKKLSAHARAALFDVIRSSALAVGIGIVGHDVIDEINILNATFRAMHEAISGLAVPPDHLLVDGPYFPGANIFFTPVVGGDSRCFSIAAASVIAKVTRDRLMEKYDSEFPQYGFARHKGYGTKDHLDAIRRYGPCRIHRKSFRMPQGVL
jgi:ribonuclease HII